jgi:NAD(P)-dependent dehydrogenase (short-subunit alcohol dehydrogenase family)
MAKGYTAADVPDLSGKTIVVTGANSGIGLEASLVLAGRGAQLVMACRSAEKAKGAVERIKAAHPSANVEVRSLDLASLASIRAFAAQLVKDRPAIDVLINNAGIMAIPRTLTSDGFEMQIGTNHLGHFALTGLLLPALGAAKSARVVSVSSQVHRMGKIRFDDLMGERRYDKWDAYSQSKLANLLFTFELVRRLEKKHPGVKALACHPGYSATNLQSVGPTMERSWTGGIFSTGNAVMAQSAAMGALPTIRAACDPEAAAGDYYGPRGLFELWGYPTKVSTTRGAKDESVARQLWDRSIELTQVDYLR